MAKKDLELEGKYEEIASAAHHDGVKASDEADLLVWIRARVKYRPDTEFFIFLGVGAALADLEAQEEGYKNQAERAYDLAMKKLDR
jgi:hypothetical protein